MKRKEKIQLLNDIKIGVVKPGILNPGKVFIFFQISSNPAVYECEDKTYTEDELFERCKEIKQNCQKYFVWNEEKGYGKKPVLIINSVSGTDELSIIALPDNGR